MNKRKPQATTASVEQPQQETHLPPTPTKKKKPYWNTFRIVKEKGQNPSFMEE